MAFRMYQDAQAFAEILELAGNLERAAQVRENCREVARNHVLDRILNPHKIA
jgi:hypothetical protein